MREWLLRLPSHWNELLHGGFVSLWDLRLHLKFYDCGNYVVATFVSAGQREEKLVEIPCLCYQKD